METKQNTENILRTLREELPCLREKFNVESLQLFGSYVKQKQTPGSDVDILVTFSEVPGFIKFINLENYLSDKLNLQVDLVMEDALKKKIGDRIKEEAVSV